TNMRELSGPYCTMTEHTARTMRLRVRKAGQAAQLAEGEAAERSRPINCSGALTVMAQQVRPGLREPAVVLGLRVRLDSQASTRRFHQGQRASSHQQAACIAAIRSCSPTQGEGLATRGVHV